MENIFENAKFGDKFRSSDGRMFIYNRQSRGVHLLMCENNDALQPYFDDGVGVYTRCEIVSKYQPLTDKDAEDLQDKLDDLWMRYLSHVSLWKLKYRKLADKINKPANDPIEEDKLNELARINVASMFIPSRYDISSRYEDTAIEAFKKGYLALKEELTFVLKQSE